MNGALYRRFRPDTFEKVIGQDHIVKTLVNQIAADKLSHAYLFTGTRGTGKTSTAKIFAKAVNCLSPVGGSACGVCDVCVQLKNPSNLDVIEIDAASNNGVDEIRELKENVRYRPSSGKYKVYIIDEVHMLSISAFNALLKTLEEPPSHVIFILATTEAHKLPQTVLSRCIRFDFRLVSDDDLANHLMRVFDQDGQEYEEAAIKLIARHGEGSVRDTLSLADMISAYANGKITLSLTESALGASSFDTLFMLAAEILSGETSALLKDFDKLMREGKNPQNLAKDLAQFFMNIMFSASADAKTLAVTEEELAALKNLESQTERKKLTRAIEILTSLEGDLRYTTQPKLLVGAAIVKAAELEMELSQEATMARLRILEKELQKLKEGGFVSKATDNIFRHVDSARTADTAEKLKKMLDGAKEVSGAPMFKAKEDDEAERLVQEERRKNMVLWQSVRELLKEREEFTLSAAAADITDVKITDGEFLALTDSKQACELLNDPERFMIVKDIVKSVVGEAVNFKVLLTSGMRAKTSAGDNDKKVLRELFGGSLLKK